MITKAPHSPLRILLATATSELREALRGQQHINRVVEVVASTTDTTEVQSLAIAYVPDALVFDATLPGILEAAATLLHLTLGQSRLLVLEVHPQADRLIRWLQVGACDILTPPLSIEQVVSAVIRACDMPRPAPQAATGMTTGTQGAAQSPSLLLVSKTSGAGTRLATILRQRLTLAAVEQARTIRDALMQAAQLWPTVTLIDADQFGRTAFDMAAQLRLYVPTTCAILLAAQADVGKLQLAAQSGIRDYLLKPPKLDQLAAAMSRAQLLSTALAHTVHTRQTSSTTESAPALLLPAIGVPLQREQRCRVFTVYSPGGGNGCTALACGLALLLQRRGQRVALLDADLQFGNVAALLGLEGRVTLDDFAARVGFIRWPEEELTPHASGVHVLPAPVDIAQGARVTADTLKRVVQRLREHYDVLVVDAPHSLNDYSVRLLKIADYVLVPVRAWKTQQHRITALRTLLTSSGFDHQRLYLIHSGFGHDPAIEAAAVINLDVLAAQLAAGDDLDLTALEDFVDGLLAP